MDCAELKTAKPLLVFFLRDEKSDQRYVTYFEHLTAGDAFHGTFTASEFIEKTNSYTSNHGIGSITLSPHNQTVLAAVATLPGDTPLTFTVVPCP